MQVCLLGAQLLTLPGVVLLQLGKLVSKHLILVSHCASLGLHSSQVLTKSLDLLVLHLGVLPQSYQFCLVLILFLQ